MYEPAVRIRCTRNVFATAIIERKGRQGLVWRGVRVHCRIAQEHVRGQSIAVEYLLAPGADVLAILRSCRDELGISADVVTWALASGPVSPPHPGRRLSTMGADESITALAVAPRGPEAGRWNWGGIRGEERRGVVPERKGRSGVAARR